MAKLMPSCHSTGGTLARRLPGSGLKFCCGAMPTYPLGLPRSVKAAAQKLAREEGVSMNQFVATAVAEKLAAMSTAAFFAERAGRADFAACRHLLDRSGGEAPQAGDER